MSIDINLNVNVYFAADKPLLDALVYAGGWAASLYKVMKPNATKPPITKADVHALHENNEYNREAEHAEKPPVTAQEPAPNQDATTSTNETKKAPETEKLPEEKPKEEPPASTRPKPEEIRKVIRSYIGEPEDEGHDARSDVLQKWLHEHDLQTIPNATDEQVKAFLAFIEEKKKEVSANA